MDGASRDKWRPDSGEGGPAMRSLLTAVFTPICAWAGVTAVMEPSVPEFADGESYVRSAVEPVVASASELMTISAAFPNAVTNQLEVWLCADDAASRACRDVVLGIDEGRLFVAGRDAGSEMFDSVLLPSGQIMLSITARSSQVSGNAVVGVSINGADNSFARSSIVSANPFEWRSVRVVSRGLSDDMPVMTVAKNRIGTTLKMR